MKILHVESGMNLYGGALQVLYLLRGLQAYPEVSSVLVCPEGSAIAAAAEGLVERVHAVPMRGDLDLGFIGRLTRLIRAERPDLVHLHSRRGADVLGGIAARRAGVKALLTRRVDNPESFLVAKLKYALFDRVVTISQGIRNVLLGEAVPEDKLVCVPSAVDCERFDRPCEREWFLREFDLPADSRALGVIAQLIPRKGHRHLLKALPALVARHPELRVLCFGKGPLEAELGTQIAAAGLGDVVRLAGFRDDLERVLPCLYAVVHPADMEGLGVSLLQGAAAGVPLIGTAIGGIPEVVRDGESGLLIPWQDSEALGRAIERLLGDPDLAQRLGTGGRALVRREFSIEAMVAGNLRVYRELLG